MRRDSDIIIDELHKVRVNEDSTLYKGIFWVTDLEDVGNNKLYFQIPVDSLGNISNQENLNLNSKNSDNYNHKRTWEELSSKQTDNKPFDYYPRGRVEIANGKAIIYANPNICTDNVVKWVKQKFNLNPRNGIKSVRVIPDYSKHYQCYLDR